LCDLAVITANDQRSLREKLSILERYYPSKIINFENKQRVIWEPYFPLLS